MCMKKEHQSLSVSLKLRCEVCRRMMASTRGSKNYPVAWVNDSTSLYCGSCKSHFSGVILEIADDIRQGTYLCWIMSGQLLIWSDIISGHY